MIATFAAQFAGGAAGWGFEDAEHCVAVDHQLRHVGNGRWVVGLAVRAGDEGHEATERFGVVEQLGQAVEGVRVVAGNPHRVGGGCCQKALGPFSIRLMVTPRM